MKISSIIVLSLLTAFSSNAFSNDNSTCQGFLIDSRTSTDAKIALDKMIRDINEDSSIVNKLSEDNICHILSEAQFSKILDMTMEDIERENQESIDRELFEGKIDAAMESMKN
ncbi:MAG: hypothetical protein PHY93_03810 [Bacteriovorax sp.]|nr:hypothetical protein [Bacteriovorax sp.]